VIIWGDIGCSCRFLDFCEEPFSFLDGWLAECDFGPIPPDGGNFWRWGVLGHHDVGWNVFKGGSECEGLGVIARALSSDTCLQFFIGELAEGILCASELERADSLEMFGLQEDSVSGSVVQELTGQHWGDVRDISKPTRGLLNRIQSNGGVFHLVDQNKDASVCNGSESLLFGRFEKLKYE
jgi:hypothetical protein